MRAELKNWTLTVIPHAEYARHGDGSVFLPDGYENLGATIPAIVPGNFELDKPQLKKCGRKSHVISE